MSPRIVVALAALCATACVSNGERIDARAHGAGLTRDVVQGTLWRHVIYMKPGGDHRTLWIFFESDGRPRTDAFDVVPDPTTGNPVALELLARTPVAGAYIARPCYHALGGERCSTEQWTSGRYSEAVVASMTAVVRQVVARKSAQRVILVGYSGGGTLAVLVAERVEHVQAVVTIAANLDTTAWTTLHKYLPLTPSLNPAASDKAHPWREIHLSGGKDANVPSSVISAYLARYPAATLWTYANDDHICCWVDEWPQIYERLRATLE